MANRQQPDLSETGQGRPSEERSPAMLSPGIAEFLLALADDKHLMGQQHAEWIGVTPFLEEDLAFCSIGQDELGHAALLYELLVGDDDTEIDAVAFGRSASEYRSCHLVEWCTADWPETFIRHWLFDLADSLRWKLLAESSLTQLRDLAARVEREELFHRMHAERMLDVLLADAEGFERLRAAVVKLSGLVQGLFEPVAGEAEAIEARVASGAFADSWTDFVSAVEGRVGGVEWGSPPAQNERRTRSSDWQTLLTRMREVIDLDTSAVW